MLRATVAAAREALTHRPVSSTAAHNAAVQQLQHLRELMSQLGAEDFAGLLKPPQSPAPVILVLAYFFLLESQQRATLLLLLDCLFPELGTRVPSARESARRVRASA